MIKLTRDSVTALTEKFNIKPSALDELCNELCGQNIEICDRDEKTIELKREALAFHLGIHTKDIKAPELDNYDDEFEVSFGYVDATFSVEVVSKETAESNERENSDFNDEYISENAIGIYTKIINTDFYFRWL